MASRIPQASIERLCALHRTLKALGAEGREFISSRELEERTGISAQTIRKDVSLFGLSAGSEAGYSIPVLSEAIKRELGFGGNRRVCVVGLGRMGTAILNYPDFEVEGYILAAGFDVNINRIELLVSTVPLFPAYEIPSRVQELGIELAILAVPEQAVEDVVAKLVRGGIRGIVSFAPGTVRLPKEASGIYVRTVSVVEELKILSSHISFEKRGV